MNAEQVAALRAPFPAEQVGKLPRATKKDAPKGKCAPKNLGGDAPAWQDFFCGGWHGLPAVHLDYVGHAAVTDRLLEVDPSWNWEPVAADDHGRPIFELDGRSRPVGLWIRLTVCGVTRLGFGSCPSDQFDAEKVLLGDALRNAAMRFGVALDLWVKGHDDDEEDRPSEPPRPAVQMAGEDDLGRVAAAVAQVPDGQRDAFKAWWVAEGCGALQRGQVPAVKVPSIVAKAAELAGLAPLSDGPASPPCPGEGGSASALDEASTVSHVAEGSPPAPSDDLPPAEPTPAQVLAHTIRHELDAGQRAALKAWCAAERVPLVVAKMTARQQERVAKLIVSGDLHRMALAATTPVAASQETTEAPETAA